MNTNPNLMTDEEIQGEIEAMKNKVAKLENILNARKEEEKKINWKKIGKSLLYPHPAVLILLTPISIAFLVFSLVYFDSTNILAIISYLLAFYVLLVFCFKIPNIIAFFKKFKNENKYAKNNKSSF